MTRRASVVLVVLAGALALSGCGEDQGASPATSTLPSASVPAPATTTTATTTTSAPASTKPAPPATATRPVPGPSCPDATRWGTDDRSGGPMSRDAVYLVRSGRHPCYDRVVFALNGSADVGFAGRYLPVVTSDPKGDPLPVPGGAALEIAIRAPALGSDDSGHQPGRVLASVGDTMVSTPAWPSLRAVRFAGSFEGRCVFAVGVRAELPFRVFTQIGPDRIRRMVLDIAH
jgi:hypothetical protein